MPKAERPTAGQDGHEHPRRCDTGVSTLDFTPAGFQDLADELQKLLGRQYDKLRASYERGRSSPTPPTEVHRLVHLIDYAREVSARLARHDGTSTLTLDADLICELLITRDVFRRWRNHPEWPALVQALASPLNVQHNVMTLAVASYLADAGNGVGLVPSPASGRIPDIWIQPSLIEKVELEVKTPLDFRGPLDQPLAHGPTVEHIEQVLNEAASTKRGQLDPKASGILAIGAFHLGPGGVETLERAAHEVLDRQKTRKPHVVGIGLFEASYTEIQVGQSASLQPLLNVRLVRHPNYQGSVAVEPGTLAVPTTPLGLSGTIGPPGAAPMNQDQRRALAKRHRHQ